MVVVLIILGVWRFQRGSSPSDPEGEISWQQAVDLVKACRVKVVMQAHSLKVDLTLKSGQQALTNAPAIDEIFRVVDLAAPKCGPITIGTE